MPYSNILDLFFSNQTFKHPSTTNDEGLIGISFELTVEDILTAYRFGIFPVNDPADPIAWWSPNPRWVLNPGHVKIAKSMKKLIKQRPWHITVDTCFAQVMRMCALGKTRKSNSDSWITEEIIVEYSKLFDMGLAHSFEVWKEEELIGGFYGVVTGTIFAGESKFSNVSNSSKYAFILGCKFFEYLGIELIDCQMHSSHLESLGAYPLHRNEYLEIIKLKGFTKQELTGSWTKKFESFFNTLD